MNGRDEWLLWMVVMDGCFGLLLWMVVMDGRDGWS